VVAPNGGWTIRATGLNFAFAVALCDPPVTGVMGGLGRRVSESWGERSATEQLFRHAKDGGCSRHSIKRWQDFEPAIAKALEKAARGEERHAQTG
jgi:hypothetical protein